jgi:ribA/ribD-fused uncharacterized protein
MAPGFPINVLGVRIATAEAIYQACRFPHMPDVQKLIIAQASPMTAKMRSKPYRKDSRADWDAVRIPIMKWCLRVKLVQNWSKFGALLLDTGDRPIVEDSRKDDFWGATPDEDGILRGRNVLGRLLMELRERLKTQPESLAAVTPVPIPDFRLFLREIPIISRSPVAEAPAPSRVQDVPSLLNLITPVSEEAIASPTPTQDEPLAEPVSAESATTELKDGQIPTEKRYSKVVWLGVGATLLAFILWYVAT